MAIVLGLIVFLGMTTIPIIVAVNNTRAFREQVRQAQIQSASLGEQVQHFTKLFEAIKGSGRLTLNEFQAACTPARWRAPDSMTDAAVISQGMMIAIGQHAAMLRATLRERHPYNPQDAARVLGELLREIAYSASLSGYTLEEIGKIELETLRVPESPGLAKLDPRNRKD